MGHITHGGMELWREQDTKYGKLTSITVGTDELTLVGDNDVKSGQMVFSIITPAGYDNEYSVTGHIAIEPRGAQDNLHNDFVRADIVKVSSSYYKAEINYTFTDHDMDLIRKYEGVDFTISGRISSSGHQFVSQSHLTIGITQWDGTVQAPPAENINRDVGAINETKSLHITPN